MKFQDLKIGDFFKMREDGAITYQKRWRENIEVAFSPVTRIESAWNTRTGEFEYIWGEVFTVEAMSDQQIEAVQADQKMWGEIAQIHNGKLRADIQ